MSDYELLTVVLMILGIIVSILIAYIKHKKVTALWSRNAVTVFVTNFRN